MYPRIPALVMTLALIGCADVEPPTTAVPAILASATFPDVIPLPDGFWPEGITFGRGSTFYVGSIATGAVYRGDARTGTGSLLVPAEPGVEKIGMKYDARTDRLYVAAGFTGQAFAYDASSGALLASWQLAPAGTALINDVAIAGNDVWFTDSFNPVLYRLPLGSRGALPAADGFETVPLTGDFEFVEDFVIGNANGIAATEDGKRLIVVNSESGALYVVDPRTGAATAIDLGGDALFGGDGILLNGRTLHVVLGDIDAIAVLELSPDLTSGTIVQTLTHPALDFPSTIARFGPALYAVNARFDVEPTPTLDYSVVRVPMRP
jgi:DNA-binding beta-propeller fold protein YncE